MSERPAPSRRVVLVGASNLAIHLPVVVETARRIWGSPLEVMAAVGHGRSYGATTSVLGRVLPGILNCGLWQDLRDRPQAHTAALVTDIGNDLLYGMTVEQIAEWVDECLSRLAPVARPLVVTELPLESAQSLTAWRFALMRTAFFPSCRLSLDDALAQAAELNERVRELAARYEALLVRPSAAWYGLDPIHIRRTGGAIVWREILGRWSPLVEAEAARASLAQWIALRRMRPLERRLWGRVQRQAQPAGRMPDGTTIWLY
ncbi:MAG: hypothetical protein KY475_20450 [Planctomycetes bacterium]|nr:hypothetical protein [Planctomycetota bacterium]